MLCKICNKEFELKHFNEKYCCFECKWKAERNVKERYKKSKKGKISNAKWIKSERRTNNERTYRQKPRARHLAVLRATRCLKKNKHLQERKKIRDKAFGKTTCGREINKKSAKKYRKTEKGKQSNKNAKARRRQAEKSGRVTVEEWNAKLREFDYKCARCRCMKKLEQDHIVPLSKGGKHIISNIQPLCRSCNASKGDKIES